MGKIGFKALAIVVAAIGLSWVGGASAAVETVSLDQDNCTGHCLASGGTANVTVDDTGGTLAFDVVLTSPLFFQHTTGLTDFLFSLSGGPAITITGLTSGFATIPAGGSETAGSLHEDGFGQFMYGINFTGASGTVQELKFTVADAGTLTLGSLAESGIPPGSSSVLFAADVFSSNLGGNTGNGATGPIGGNTVSAVPETSTWGMMVLGFVGLGYAAYRRPGRQSISALA